MGQTENRALRQLRQTGRWGDEQERETAAARAPLRVLIVAPSHDILGGQSVHAAQLVKEFTEEPTLEVGFLPITPRAPGFLRYLQRIKYVRTIITSIVYLLMMLVRIPRYDIIHISCAAYTGFIVSTMPPVFISKLFGKKVVLNYHAGQAEEHLRDWKRTAIPTIRRADAIVVSSFWLVDVLARYGLRAHAIFNHVELGNFRFRSRCPLRPVFFSNRNFDPIYNVPCVLRAFALIQRRFPEASLKVVGEGAQRDELQRLVRDLNLRHVEFTGLVEPKKMPELYDAADIYLNASNVDNMPLSIIEAFAAGLAVVTTDAGGIPYMVSHEETGLLVRMNDAEGMAAAAIRFLEDKALSARVMNNARAECDKYMWSAVREEWLGFYRQVAEGREALETRS